MLDIKFIRENSKIVKKSLKDRGNDFNLDKFLEIDKQRRELQTKLDQLKTKKNEASKKIGAGGDKAKVLDELKQVDAEADQLTSRLKAFQSEFDKLLNEIPNIPRDDVPVGKDESENKALRSWGEPTKFDFEPKNHAVLGKQLDLIDTEASADVSGSRFNYLKGELVLMQFALLQLGFKMLTDENELKKVNDLAGSNFNTKPFEPVLGPDMIRSKVYKRMGRLTDKDKGDKYYLEQDDLYLAGSSEHAIAPMHMDHTFEEKELPVRYVGYSTAFRREAGTYGKDTTGILRRHQFDKLEMFAFNQPDESDNEQYFFVAIQEYLMQQLKIPYQVVNLCTGEMGPTNARHIDIEAWLPGQQKYRETHTADMNTDYQSRGLGTKFKKGDGTKEFVHTNDATVFAMGRTLIAILENYQQKNGSVKIPEVLAPYVGFDVIKPIE